MSLGYGELDAKLLMYYLVMFLTGFVGYCFGLFDGGKTPEEE